MTLDLSERFSQDLSAWITWPEGEFEVEVKYLSVGASERLVKACQETTWESKSHQRVEKMNDEKFKRKIADLVVSWKGLTVEKARKFVYIKEDTPSDGVFDSTGKNKLFVINEFPGFVTFVLDSAKELHKLKEGEQESDEKNS